ncbi:GvpL/GvpF family gas vesicle protein [Streptomyces sp. NPDC053493]|uniref:GvpL/GvpF family gas vesicle protein n=1 Tax=Streptomyces sp. NPDC053493 TaxID=3365705 RepID=UPI0037CEC559
MTDRVLLYVYAVGADGAALDDVARDVTGIDGTALRCVAGPGGLTALVSPVDGHRFAEEALPAQLEDLERLEAIARSHHGVVDAAFARTTALPLRLATVYRDEERVVAMLTERQVSFSSLLETLHGQVEMGVKVYARAPAAAGRAPGAVEAAVAAGDGADSPGRAYLQRRRAQRRAVDDVYRSASAAADDVTRRAERHASARAMHRPQQNAWSAGRGENVVNDAYLVPAALVDAFRADIAALADPASGVVVEVTGPWAPYSFAGADAVSAEVRV